MLSEIGGYEICDLCEWEDDGGDGFGPNATSLSEATLNFNRFCTSYGMNHRRDGMPSSRNNIMSTVEADSAKSFAYPVDELQQSHIIRWKNYAMNILQNFKDSPTPEERGVHWKKYIDHQNLKGLKNWIEPSAAEHPATRSEPK